MTTSTSWYTLPKLFITSFFDDHIDDIQKNGFPIKVELLDKPLDTALFVVSLVSKANPVVATALATKNIYNATKTALSNDPSIPSIQKILGVALYSGAALSILSSIPMINAAEYNSLAEAKAAFPGQGCDAYLREKMFPIKVCLQKGGSLTDCKSLVENMDSDLYIFTNHNGPVSIVQLHNDKTCVLTALDSASDVTKTCFTGSDLSTRSVERVEGLSLTKAHEGLEPGESVQHVGLFKHFTGCGIFRKVDSNFNLGDEPVCMLTSLNPGGSVSQVCFDPAQPESLVLKPAPEGIILEHSGDQPASIIVKNPEKFGLDIKPEYAEPCQIAEVIGVKGVSLLDALRWWWYQETPWGEDSL